MPTFQELLGSRLAALGTKSQSSPAIPDLPPPDTFSVGGYGLIGGPADRSSLQDLEGEAAYREQEARIAQEREDQIRRRQQYRKAVDQTSRMNLRNETGFMKPPTSDEQILKDATADADRKLKDDKNSRMIQSSPFARMAVVRARAQDLIADGMDPSAAMQQAEEEKTKTDAIEQSSYELELAENESKGQGLREGSEIFQRSFLDLASAGARLVGARETADNWLATSEGVGRANEELRTRQDKYKSRILGIARDDISRAISSAGQSIVKTTLAAPATLVGGPAAGLAAMNFIYGTDSWNKGLKAAEDAGLKGNDRHEFAVKEAASELLLMNVMQRIPGFGGTESLALKPIVRQSLAKTSVSALTNLTGEVIEEVGTDILHRMNAVNAGVDPSAMDPEKLSAGLKETIGVTLLTTAMMGSPQVASTVRNYIADPTRTKLKELSQIEEAKPFVDEVTANGSRGQRESVAEKLKPVAQKYEEFGAAQAQAQVADPADTTVETAEIVGENVDSLPTDDTGVQEATPAPGVSSPPLPPTVNDQPSSIPQEQQQEQKPAEEPWYPGQIPTYQPSPDAVSLGTGDEVAAFYEPSSGATFIVDQETQKPITGLEMRKFESVEQATEWAKSQGIATTPASDVVVDQEPPVSDPQTDLSVTDDPQTDLSGESPAPDASTIAEQAAQIVLSSSDESIHDVLRKQFGIANIKDRMPIARIAAPLIRQGREQQAEIEKQKRAEVSPARQRAQERSLAINEPTEIVDPVDTPSSVTPEELGQLLVDNEPVIRRQIAGKVKDSSTVDDLVQDVNAKVLERGGWDPSKGKFSAWVNTVATNVLRDHYRKQQSSRETQGDQQAISQVPDASAQRLEPDEAPPAQAEFDPDQGVVYSSRKDGDFDGVVLGPAKRKGYVRIKLNEPPEGTPPGREVKPGVLTARELTEAEKQPKSEPTFDDNTREAIANEEPLQDFRLGQKVSYRNSKGVVSEATVVGKKGRVVQISSGGRQFPVNQNQLSEPEEDPIVRIARENEVTEDEVRDRIEQSHFELSDFPTRKNELRKKARSATNWNKMRISNAENQRTKAKESVGGTLSGGGDYGGNTKFTDAAETFVADNRRDFEEIFGQPDNVAEVVWNLIGEGDQEIPGVLSEEVIKGAAEIAVQSRKSSGKPLSAAEQAEREMESLNDFDLEGTDTSFDFGANAESEAEADVESEAEVEPEVESEAEADIEIETVGKDGKRQVEKVTREEAQKRSVDQVLKRAQAEKITRGEQMEGFAANNVFHNDSLARQAFSSAKEFGTAARAEFEARQNTPIEMKGEPAIREVKPEPEKTTNNKAKQPDLFIGKNDLPGQETLFGIANFDKEDAKKPDPSPRDLVDEGDERRESNRDDNEQRSGFGIGGIGAGGKETARPDAVPDSVKADNPEFEEAIQNARGYQPESMVERVKRGASEFWAMATRAQRFVPRNGKFGRFNEFFRLLKAVPEAASDEVNRTIAEIVDELGPQHLIVFERKLIYENLIAALNAGQPLRFRAKSQEEVQAELDKINRLLESEELAPVRRALEKRDIARRKLVKRMVDQGLMDEQAIDNDSYFHQQVLTRLMLDSRYSNTGAANEMKRSFQKRRKQSKNEGEAWDESYDWNTSYLESEATWMTEAEIEIRKHELLSDLPDQMAEFRQRAKDLNYEAVVGGPANARRLEKLRGEQAEIRNQSSMDSGDKARLKEISEEIWELDPTMPFRQRMAIAVGQFEKETGLDFSKPDSPDLQTEINRVMSQPDGTPGKGPAGGYLKALSERKQFIQETLGKDLNSWESLVRENDDVGAWQPRQGNLFFRAFTIPERIAEMLQLKIIEEAQLSLEDLQQVTVVGPQRTPMILPVEVVNELNNTTKTKADGFFTELLADAMGAWKIHTLLFPKRLAAYMARNVTGDIDPVIGGAPGVFKYMAQANRELYDFYRSKKKLGISDTLRIARDLGVVDSGMSTADLPDLKNMRMFNRFYSENPLSPVKAFANYYDWAKSINGWREGIARYAAFLHYRDALKTGTLKHYGGANREVVNALVRDLGVDVAAAHLSRNLLGDYGNLTVMGDVLRKRMIPFWAFQEVNLKRYPRLIQNAWQSGDKKTAASAATVALARVIAVSNIARFTAACVTWNHLIMPLITGDDEEEDLPIYDRQNPHINLGKNADGTTTVFRGVGAMGDFMEWFGLNSFPQLFKHYQNGQITLDEMFIEMAKDPANKVAGGIRPEVKVIGELWSGQSTFPDVFNPRAVARDETIPSSMGLVDEYRWMRGMLLGDGTRPREHYFQRMFFGISDPRANAINEMHDLRQKFLSLEGKDSSNVGQTSRYKTIREAAFNQDYDAFVEAKEKYLKDGGTLDGFEAFLQRLDPVDGRLSDAMESKFENEFLTPEQRQKLSVARDYSKEIEVTLWQWWVASTSDVTEGNDLENRKSRLVYQSLQASRDSSDEVKEQADNAFKRLAPMEMNRTEAKKHLDAYFLDQAQKRADAEAEKRNRSPRAVRNFERTDAYYARLRKLNQLFSNSSGK